MGQFKIVDAQQLDADLTAVAQAIREKNGTQEALVFPEGFVEAIDSLQIDDGETQDLFWLYSTNQLHEYTTDLDGEIVIYNWRENSGLQKVNYTNLKKAGKYMFQNCVNLTDVRLPSAEIIQHGVFTACYKLEEVCLPAAVEFHTGVFERCTALRRCDFPAAQQFGLRIFKACSALQTLILRAPVVCTLSDDESFNGTPIESGTGYIYVPAALVEEYQAAAYWSAYAAQFRAIEEYPEITGGETA